MFRFQLTTTLCYGPDSLSALADLDGRRVLIITDSFLAATPLMGQVRSALSAATVEVFDQVIPNPDVAAVAAGLRAFLAFGPDALVALGGGSPIDTAKAVRKLALEQGHRADAGFYVIPTTSGTGSEVTSFAVVTDPHSHAKLPLTSADMLPDVAILDPEAVATAPPRLVADSGMDAVSHAIEAYVALGHNDFSDALAEKALRIADTYLVRSYRSNTDLKAREHQHTGATMAGIAFQNSGLGIVHGLSHAIGGSFAVAHGRLNGILLPHVIEYNAGVLGLRPSHVSPVGRRYVSLAGAIGLTASSDRNVVFGLVGWLERIRRELEMPASMTEAGIDAGEFRAAIPALAATARKDFCTSGNPVPATEGDLAGILHAIV
ncbi:1-propanol dehydrogenase PduQ [Propionicimonas sp.]|uniref:1-propanol dehydrogenase PduQ n=1 Tax=Propionicimonas sp. TaxID=1955623 RepID=UPI0039E6B240